MTHAIRELLAVDPGIRFPAAARFVDGILIAAARTPMNGQWSSWGIGQRCLAVGRSIAAWSTAKRADPVTHAIIEWPQVYRKARRKGDPNDLPPLAGVGMAVVALLHTLYPALVVQSPLPAEVWQQMPKDEVGDPWASIRGMRIRSRLTAAEFAAVVPSHDAVDAVGLGLWALGRFERARVFPGAT